MERLHGVTPQRLDCRTACEVSEVKARTSGKGGPCEAVQLSDQMRCERCGFTYDVNDPDPPDCKTPVRFVTRTPRGTFTDAQLAYRLAKNGE